MDVESQQPFRGTPEALKQEQSGKQLTATVFDYRTPTDLRKTKSVVRLCRSDIIYGSVQVLKSGGENNLHAHAAQDGMWMVLRGRARFYGMDDALLAEVGPLQGVHIPRGFYYWFENASAELLELLHVSATDKTIESERFNATPEKVGYIDFL
jgi:mannose-6-phosphate isomerase-like protein (cupin superfamily)